MLAIAIIVITAVVALGLILRSKLRFNNHPTLELTALIEPATSSLGSSESRMQARASSISPRLRNELTTKLREGEQIVRMTRLSPIKLLPVACFLTMACILLVMCFVEPFITQTDHSHSSDRSTAHSVATLQWATPTPSAKQIRQARQKRAAQRARAKRAKLKARRAAAAAPRRTQTSIIPFWLLAALVAVVWALLPAGLLEWLWTVWVITDQRVIKLVHPRTLAPVRAQFRKLEMDDISTTSVLTGLAGRLFGYGTAVLSSKIQNTEDPGELWDAVHKMPDAEGFIADVDKMREPYLDAHKPKQ